MIIFYLFCKRLQFYIQCEEQIYNHSSKIKNIIIIYFPHIPAKLSKIMG